MMRGRSGVVALAYLRIMQKERIPYSRGTGAAKSKKMLTEVGFEPTPFQTAEVAQEEPKRSALDHFIHISMSLEERRKQ
jgi:hypothetical protein